MSPSPPPLERFMPYPDVRERFEVVVRAPAELVMAVASGFDMQSLPIVKAIFWLRERLLRAGSPAPRSPQGILAETRALGWGCWKSNPAGSSSVARGASHGWRTSAFRPSPRTTSRRTPRPVR
jgi:hypothetical protein